MIDDFAENSQQYFSFNLICAMKLERNSTRNEVYFSARLEKYISPLI